MVGSILIRSTIWSHRLSVRSSGFHPGKSGSIPGGTTMSKRYSESSNQDFKNDSAECLRREWDIVGTKEDTQLLPVVLDVFMGDAPQVFKK